MTLIKILDPGCRSFYRQRLPVGTIHVRSAS